MLHRIRGNLPLSHMQDSIQLLTSMQAIRVESPSAEYFFLSTCDTFYDFIFEKIYLLISEFILQNSQKQHLFYEKGKAYQLKLFYILDSHSTFKRMLQLLLTRLGFLFFFYFELYILIYSMNSGRNVKSQSSYKEYSYFSISLTSHWLQRKYGIFIF